MIRRPPRSTQSRSSAASDVYKRQGVDAQAATRDGSPRARPPLGDRRGRRDLRRRRKPGQTWGWQRQSARDDRGGEDRKRPQAGPDPPRSHRPPGHLGAGQVRRADGAARIHDPHRRSPDAAQAGRQGLHPRVHQRLQRTRQGRRAARRAPHRVPTQTMAHRDHALRRRRAPTALLPRRVHLQIQPPRLQQPRPALLPTHPASRQHRPPPTAHSARRRTRYQLQLSRYAEHMFATLDDLNPTEALARAVDRRRTADRAEAELLAIAAHWADLHPVLSGPDGVRVKGMERLMPLAGPGTPEVAEFAPAELGAALAISTFAAQHLVGDALELRHRLPRLWARIMNGTLQPWRGRQVADRTSTLSIQAAAWVDANVAPFAHKISLNRVSALIEAALIRFDPDEAARRAKAAADGRGVWVSDQMTDGTRSIRIEADALDAAAFDQTIAQIADTLAQLGDQDLNDVRRAKAVGVIADPQTALHLLTGPNDADNPDTAATSTGAGAPAPGTTTS